MKKGLVFSFVFVFIFIILVSFVSAGFFSNLWGKITGKVTYSSCSDSDMDYNYQYGDNPYKQGTFDGSSDSCFLNTLTEYYCEDGGYGYIYKKSKTYDCASLGRVCSNGACVTDCSDTDAGKNYYEKGAVIDRGVNYNDYCPVADYVREFYCGLGGHANEDYDCSLEGKICQDGACVTPFSSDSSTSSGTTSSDSSTSSGTTSSDSSTSFCSETDSGIDISHLGKVTDSSGIEFPDVCYNSTAINETSCEDPTQVLPSGEFNHFRIGSDAFLVQINCPSGQICQDGACVSQTSSNRWEQLLNCEDCTQEGYNWCPDLEKCTNSPVEESNCDNFIDTPQECYSQSSGCISNVYDLDNLEITNEHIKKYIKEIKSDCNLNFNFGDVLEDLPQEYSSSFNIPNRKVVKVLNISSSNPDVQAVINISLNESEFKWPIENISIYVEPKQGYSQWELIEGQDKVKVTPSQEDKVYTYQFVAPHFSLFAITEPDYCGNGVFEKDYYEECDGSEYCTSECVCESGYVANETGFCVEDISNTECSLKGNETCSGYVLFECGDDLKWNKKGKVVGECGVECELVGNMSCQGDVSLRCGSDYKWNAQGKINGLCGYISGSSLSYNYSGQDNGELKYCGNGYCGYNEDEFNCPEDCTAKDSSNKWMLSLIIGVLSLLILLIIFALFSVYKKGQRRFSPSPNRNIPPQHRPGPKRPPGRPEVVHHRQIGRPPIKRMSPGGYAVRRYPK